MSEERLLLLWLVAGIALSVLVTVGEGKTCKLSCSRTSKLEGRGFGISKRPLNVDVGECSKVFIQEDDCEIPAEGDDECPRECGPRSYWLESHSNRDGPFTMKTVKSCYATKHHCNDCAKKPSFVYLFPDSKYQTRVNVSKCSGVCNETGRVCTPTRKSSIAVEGPNGYVTIDSVEECGCVSTVCYREDYFESYSEQISSPEQNNTTELKRQEKVINIGRCIGDCSGVTIPAGCAHPDYETYYDCLINGYLWFYERPSKCVPTLTTAHSFTNLDEETVTIHAIDQCGCGTA